MRTRRQSWIPLAIGAVVLACGGTNGATGSTDNLSEAPDLPPVESLIIDLSFFTAGDGSGTGPAVGASATQDHWENAVAHVGIASADATEALSLPMVTLEAATQQTAAFEGERWHWRFIATHGGLTYTGDLSGITAGSQTSFDMQLSQPSLGLSGFTSYLGATPAEGGSGFWRFFDPRTGGESAGRVDWSRPSDDAKTLAFSEVGDAANDGDVLTYEVSGTDRRLRFVEFATGDAIEVAWDAVGGSGYIAADSYNNGAKSCWDADQNDTICPP